MRCYMVEKWKKVRILVMTPESMTYLVEDESRHWVGLFVSTITVIDCDGDFSAS